MLDITHVITRLVVGGAQENTISSVLGFQNRKDWKVDIVSGPSVGTEGSLENLFDAHPSILCILPQLVRPVHPYRDIVAYRKLVARFSARRPDIVHTHSGKAGIIGRLAARRARVPIVVHTIHGPSFGPWQGSISNAMFKKAEQIAGRCTDHFVVVADAMTRQYLDVGIGVPPQYSRIWSGFDLGPFLSARRDPELSARLGIGEGDFVIGKIARLFELKGHDDLFSVAPDILRQVPRAKFLLVGDGPWREKFESRAREPDLAGRFIFSGLVRPHEVGRYIGQMDCLVHLSRREGLPRALPQSLAVGRPVVAFDCDGAGEVCRSNETGFLIPPGDFPQLVRSIVKLAESPELRRRLGATGRDWVKKRFSVETMIASLEQLYLKLALESRVLENDRRPVGQRKDVRP